jgi:hypothetical protein
MYVNVGGIKHISPCNCSTTVVLLGIESHDVGFFSVVAVFGIVIMFIDLSLGWGKFSLLFGLLEVCLFQIVAEFILSF